jgi:hypothetical protein
MSMNETLYGASQTLPGPGEDETYDAAAATAALSLLCKGVDGVSTKVGNVVFPKLRSTASTLANGATLTPTYPLHKVTGDSGGSTLAGIASGSTDGQILVVYCALNTVTIQENATNVTLVNGDVTISQYEAILFRWDSSASKWIELERSCPRKLQNQTAIEFYEARANGTNKISITAPSSLSSDITFRLPATSASGHLANDGSGNLSWDSGESAYVYDVKAYGAVGNGSADDTDAIQAAIAAAAAGAYKGVVFFPDGAYNFDETLVIPSMVSLVGNGMRNAFLNYMGSDTAIMLDGVAFVGIRHLRLYCAPSGTGIAIHMRSINPSSPAWCSFNRIDDIEIATDTITSGQIGIKIEGDGADETVFNWFNQIYIQSIHKPIITTTSTEANHFVELHVNDFGLSSGDCAVYLDCCACSFANVWFGTALHTGLVGFKGPGTINYLEGFCDIGVGNCVELTGGLNTVFMKGVGATDIGTINPGGGELIQALGRARGSCSGYDVNIIGIPGQDLSLFQVGVYGKTNGFTSQWVNAENRMVYTFAGGPVHLPYNQIFLGDYCLWVDQTGALRINYGTPPSDIYGAVVGTQE